MSCSRRQFVQQTVGGLLAGGVLVATIGVEDLVVIETSDSILIHQRGRAEDVKKIVEKLRESGAKEVEYDFSQDADIRP